MAISIYSLCAITSLISSWLLSRAYWRTRSRLLLWSAISFAGLTLNNVTLWVCAVTKAALSSGCKSHPATAPAGSNRSSHGGNEVAEAFGLACHELVTARVCRP